MIEGVLTVDTIYKARDQMMTDDGIKTPKAVTTCKRPASHQERTDDGIKTPKAVTTCKRPASHQERTGKFAKSLCASQAVASQPPAVASQPPRANECDSVPGLLNMDLPDEFI